MPEPVQQERFIGGIADGSKYSYRGQGYADGIGLDFRTDPDKLKALKKLKKDSGSTVTDLVLWIKEVEGDYWMYGNGGKIYSRKSGTYTLEKTVSDSAGQGLEYFNGALWYASNKTIGKVINPTSATPTFYDAYFDIPDKEIDGDKNFNAGSNTYTLTTGINEGATHKISFTADAIEYVALAINIVNKGTSDWTVTLHDSSNNTLAAVTIANANVGTGLRKLVFDQIPELTIGQAYHFHVTGTAASGTIKTDTASDLSTAQFMVYKRMKQDFVDAKSLPTTTNSQVDIAATDITLATSLSETNKIEFTPQFGELAGIAVIVKTASPAANWTLVVHDDNNKTIGSVTVSSANMANTYGGFKRFDFATPLSLNVDATYHFHLYISTGSDKILGSSSGFADAYYMTIVPTLLADADFHPMKEFGNLLCVGNARYLLTINDVEQATAERIVLTKSEKIRALELIGDNLAMGTWKGDDITEYGDSKFYLWDSVSDTFIAQLKVDGQISAMANDGTNQLYIVHGTEGLISMYTGRIDPMRRLKGVGENKTVEVYPQAMGAWEGVLRMGISDGSSTGIDRVVWSYGQKDKDQPMALSKDYPISTGSKGSTVQIGAILGVSADKFFVSWKDNTTYGVDIIDTANEQTSAFVQTIRIDAKQAYTRKTGYTFVVRCEPLQSGQSIQVDYRVDNNGNFQSLGTDMSTVNMIAKSYAIPSAYAQHFEIEFKITLKSTAPATTSPKLLGWAYEYDRQEDFQLDTITV